MYLIISPLLRLLLFVGDADAGLPAQKHSKQGLTSCWFKIDTLEKFVQGNEQSTLVIDGKSITNVQEAHHSFVIVFK